MILFAICCILKSLLSLFLHRLVNDQGSALLFRTPRPAAEAGRPSLDEPASMAVAGSQGRTFGCDPLTASLTHLAAYHGRAVSPEALLGGLPILDGKLTVALYHRAARRAELETEGIKRDLLDIPALVLPAVLIMNNGTALILLGVDEANNSVKVLDPLALPSAPQILPIKALTPQYTGYAFLVRPAAEADARTVAAGDLPRTHWFWSVVRRFGALQPCRDCGISDQHAGACGAVVHHERLRPRHSERRDSLPGCAFDRDGARDRVRVCAAHGAKPDH